MPALGQYLSHLRAERGLSVEELARVTRVAPRYLEALEHDDLGALPAAVFTRGYIRAYCQALGVPAAEALGRYAEGTGTPATPPAVPTPSPTRRGVDSRQRARGTLLISFVLLVGFGIALFVVALLLQSGRPEISARGPQTPRPPAPAEPPQPSPPAAAQTVEAPTSEEPPTPGAAAADPAAPPPPRTETAPPAPPPGSPVMVSGVTAPSATAPSARLPGASPAAAVSSAPPAAEPKGVSLQTSRVAAEPPRPDASDSLPARLSGVSSPYRLVARVSETTWLRVRTEDGRGTEETVPAGEVREWISNRPFTITLGNAAGVSLELNGRKLPALGGRGVVITRLVLPPPEP